MGHHRHRDRGCGGCGSCGVCLGGFGGGWPGAWPGVLPGAVVAPQVQVLPPMMPMQQQMMMQPQLAMAPVPYAAQLPTSSGQVVLAAPTGLAAIPNVQLIGPIGFKPKKVRKHHRRTVTARSNTFFRGTGIFIPRHVARHFDICSIRVGQLNLLAGNEGIPAEFYSNNGCGTGGAVFFPLPGVLYPNQKVFITVKNRSSKSRWFRAALQGTSSLY